LKNGLIVTKRPREFAIIADENFAIPKVSNQNGTTRLWAKVFDPKGVSNIEKVTANLSKISGSPVALFEFGIEKDGKFYDSRDEVLPFSPIISTNERWFFLDITVPNSTEMGMIDLPISAKNGFGKTA
jgi:hypothetical protein